MAETNVLCCYKFFINSCNDKQVILTFDINYLIKYRSKILFAHLLYLFIVELTLFMRIMGVMENLF